MTRAAYIQNRAGSNDILVFRPWTAAELAEAKALRRKGRSARSIGAMLGRTRNSVIGALHRAGEPGVLKNGNTDTGWL